jgi:hypothetical protein
VIVPDKNTETFEHTGLADKFPWMAMGDIPWTISNTNQQTGAFAAQPGPIVYGQRSTLAIVVNLPADSAVEFSVRTSIPDYGKLVFNVDSMWTDQFTGLSEWQIVQYPLTAGRHLLSWTYVGSGSGLPGNIWLDNIFFPGNVVVTSAGQSSPTVPLTFELEQNFPNPFNPTTLIRYGLPHRANVSLSVYNALGQKVADLARGTQEAGYHEVQFDASKLASGAYFYTLTADEFVQTRKLLLVR